MKSSAGLSRGQRVSMTTNRLRMVQVAGADMTDPDRAALLDEEVDQALKGLSVDERKAFIQDMMNEFPEWGVTIVEAAPSPAKPAPVASGFDTEQLKNPGFLLSRLIELIPRLSETGKQTVATELSKAGIKVSGRVEWPSGSETDLRAKLALQAADAISPERALAMLAVLSAFTMDLDQVGWATWKELAKELPSNSIRKQMDMKATLRKCASGDANTTNKSVDDGLKALRELIASFVNTIPLVAQFASAHVSNLMPEKIENLVRIGGGGGWGGIEKKCWEMYKQKSIALDHSEFERQIKKNMAEQIEGWLRSGS